MQFRTEKIGKLLEAISELRYEKHSETVTVEYALMEKDKRHIFHVEVVTPQECVGKCLVYRVDTKKNGAWGDDNPQFRVYVDDELRQGFDWDHRELVLSESAESGRIYNIRLELYSSVENYNLFLKSTLLTLDRDVEHYYYDVLVPYQVAAMLSDEEAAKREILKCLNDSLNLLDLRRERSEDYYSSLKVAQDYLTNEFYKKRCGKEQDGLIACVGHTHIDCAWLWTLAETRDKAVRSFSTVLELMKQYPEYIFMSSQPLLYRFVKEEAPDTYEKIKERIKEGRWEPEGGMYVEADCNLPSGEALVRQFLYGQKFFQNEFGKTSEILWLPDVFGYSAALPQIMQKCGIRYFMTTKINWNDTNKMPHDTFMWEGMDGSKVLTHFIPTRYYQTTESWQALKNTYETTYNGDLCASQVKGAWHRYGDKEVSDLALMAFGNGDGGGGATKEMLEHQKRLEKGIPGCPVTKMSTAKEFFKELEKQVKDKTMELPHWVGELYLEYHRGTYTSMARNKRWNRQAEFLYTGVEFYGMLQKILLGRNYPKEQLDKGWELLLQNQFHDILPGSSIKEVYEDSAKEYGIILEEGKKLVEEFTHTIADEVKGERGNLVVFNPTGFTTGGPVITDLEYQKDEEDYQVQRLADGTVILETPEIPAKGYAVLKIQDLPLKSNDLSVSLDAMENKFFRITFNKNGQFSSIFDKRAERELLKENAIGNVLRTYEDRPVRYDAWDINEFYKEKTWTIDNLESIDIVEEGPVRATVKITRTYLESTIVQYISIFRETPRIDIHNEIDWKEHQILLKMEFPVDIHTSEATYEIQYGNVKRPTHTNTSWDVAKFEVCAHKWIDVAEEGYGLSILNDCKYGYSIRDGVIGLTMLKAAIDPNPDADKECHTFTYSLYPHMGSWKEAGTVEAAYLLNTPLYTVEKKTSGGTLPDSYSLISSDSPNVYVEVVKKAEGTEEMVVRLYEFTNRRSKVKLSLGVDIEEVYSCDMLEQNELKELHDTREIYLHIKPYEIKTLKIKCNNVKTQKD